MFERFLDPHRLELPDIDVDFEDVDATKDTLRQMFGEDNVACLSTYGTFGTKGLLKDLARVYDIDHNDVNRMNRQIEKELRVLYINQDKSTIVISLDDIERVSATFNEFVRRYPDIGRLFKQLYGRNRHIGRHASGVVIGDNLPAETSIFRSKGIVQTSFTEGIVNKNLSAMGMVKFDILSIATLKIIHHALRLISKKTGRSEEELIESIRPHNLDLNDQKVLKNVFWDGRFAGVFQFTERGIRKLAQRIRPDCFDDVSAVTSLYRPGPLGSGMHKLYAENKKKSLAGELVYEHPVLEKILKRTHGCLVYQEQLMQVAQHLGKMEFKDVQRIRKVLLKKDKSKSAEFLQKENDELRGKFIAGAVESGLDQDSADRWWKNLLFFGGYGFNASHSFTYSVMTMQCAHLATYHPLEFYAAVLSKGQSGELQAYITDIKASGIKVLPVDVNESKMDHVTEDEKIRLSFTSVLGVGPAAILKIVAGQPYRDFRDFLDRSGAGKTAILPLIRVGAFDSLFAEPNMRRLEWFYERYCENPKLRQKKNLGALDELYTNTMDVGGFTMRDKEGNDVYCPDKDYELHEKVALENELMTFSLRGSPFEILDREKKLRALFGESGVPTYKEFVESDEFDEEGKSYGPLPVCVKDIREKPQKNGRMFAFIKFSTESGEEFDSPAFANVWSQIKPKMRKGSVYVGTFNRSDEDPTNLVIGKPGFAHSAKSIQGYMVDVDEIELGEEDGAEQN
jgi:DNA polymerase-3 subunit alpha